MNSLLPRQWAIIALTILALALGGTTEFWAQAVFAALAGVIILFAPPHHLLGRLPNILVLLFFALALTAFLPADWVTIPAWRQYLVQGLQIPLPFTRTPQPWLTLQSCSLLFVILVWAYYVLTQKWDGEQRLAALQLIVLGVAILAALAVVTFNVGWRMPGWNQQLNRGWFPNRNQTSDVLALCGIVNYGLIFDRLRKGRLRGLFWLITLAPICAALVVCYSRAGILMFFAGIGLWHLWPSQHRKASRHRVKWTALGMALGFILLTLFFLFGGDTLERFQNRSNAQTPSLMESDYRIFIQKDALYLSFQQPWLGMGLGNFEALFAPARHFSADQNRAIHPESDWLWVTCEMGWFAPLILLIAIGWWFLRCLPFEPKQGESLRRAATVAVVMFLMHGLVDVSGHRVGSVGMAILLVSLSMTPPDITPFQRWGGLFFRGLAGVVMAISGWWFASLHGLSVPPTTAKLVHLEGLSKSAAVSGQIGSLEKLANESLQIAPLSWPCYFQRARAEAFQRDKLSRAIADFQVARTLEPHWARLCFDEGVVWLSVNQPDLCLDAWKEAMRRNPEDSRHLYREMMDLTLSPSLLNPLVCEYLREFALEHKDCLSLSLGYSSPEDTKKTIAELLASDPDLQSLNPEYRADLFRMWWSKGYQADLIQELLGHEDWQTTGWPYLAQSYAQQKDFKRAWDTVDHFSKAPNMPLTPTDRPLADLERDFYGHPDNVATGVMLLLAQIKQGQADDAFITLHALEKLPKPPKYIFYLEARLWAEKLEWEKAWNAWWNFYSA